VPQKTATGFHRQTLTNKEGGVDAEEYRSKATVDRANTTATVWLGLTVGCAECHNHKYDPITQKEYYQFYAFFNNASEADLVVGNETSATPIVGPPRPVRVPVLVQADPARETFIHERGDFLRRGDQVQSGTLKVLHTFKPRAEKPDRLDLAAGPARSRPMAGGGRKSAYGSRRR
jgi:hypothetical protein